MAMVGTGHICYEIISNWGFIIPDFATVCYPQFYYLFLFFKVASVQPNCIGMTGSAREPEGRPMPNRGSYQGGKQMQRIPPTIPLICLPSHVFNIKTIFLSIRLQTSVNELASITQHPSTALNRGHSIEYYTPSFSKGGQTYSKLNVGFFLIFEHIIVPEEHQYIC